jgi:hypothetical protein
VIYRNTLAPEIGGIVKQKSVDNTTEPVMSALLMQAQESPLAGTMGTTLFFPSSPLTVGFGHPPNASGDAKLGFVAIPHSSVCPIASWGSGNFFINITVPSRFLPVLVDSYRPSGHCPTPLCSVSHILPITAERWTGYTIISAML